MAQVAVNFRMDAQLKQTFTKVVQGMGLTPSAAFTVFAKAVVRENAMPFQIVSDDDTKWEAWFYSTDNLARVDDAIASLDRGESVTFSAEEWDELMRRSRAHPSVPLETLRQEMLDETH